MDFECRPADEEERLERKGGETVKRETERQSGEKFRERNSERERQTDRQTDRDRDSK